MKESSKGRRVGRMTNRWTRDVAVRRRSHRRCPSNTEVKSDASHQPLEASGDAPRRVSLSATRHQLKWVLTYRSNVYAAFAIECLSYVSRGVVLIVPSLTGSNAFREQKIVRFHEFSPVFSTRPTINIITSMKRNPFHLISLASSITTISNFFLFLSLLFSPTYLKPVINFPFDSNDIFPQCNIECDANDADLSLSQILSRSWFKC